MRRKAASLLRASCIIIALTIVCWFVEELG